MHKVVYARGLALGQGMPKICIPLAGQTQEELLWQLRQALDAGADLVEWRSDCFAGVQNYNEVGFVLRQLRQALGEVPLLFTFRTQQEGGQCSLPEKQYIHLNRAVLDSNMVDLLDIEWMLGAQVYGGLRQQAQAKGVRVVFSNHDFYATAPAVELQNRLQKMAQAGADIVKIAAMPQTPQDVLALLQAGQAYLQGEHVPPMVSMSMGTMGRISRIAGSVFGSCITFGTAGAASAPGQLDAEGLRRILEVLAQE